MSLLIYQWLFKIQKISIFAIALSLLGTSHLPQKSFASANTSPEQIIFWDGFEPPGDDAPRDTSGAGSRDGSACTVNEPAVRSLMPTRNFGLTLAAHPTVFAHLPATSARQVVLIVTNEAGTYYERAFLPVPDGSVLEGGVVAFSFPSAFAPLAVGNNYQWQLVVVCGEMVQPDDPVLSGWIQRTELPTTALQTSDRSSIEQAQWYAQNGYWYELVAALNKEVRSHPNDLQLQTLWQSILTTGDASEPAP